MSRMPNFAKLLNSYRYDKSKHPLITNTRIGDIENGISGGVYYISQEDYPQFLKQFYNNIIKPGHKEYLTEKQLNDDNFKTKPFYVDLDFNYATMGRFHTQENIDNILYCYIEEIKKYCYFEGEEKFKIWVMQRDQPYTNNKGKHKDGLHILFGIMVDTRIQILIRRNLLENEDMKQILGNLPLINTIEDVFDEGITTGSTNAQLYGCCKPHCEPYKVSLCYEMIFDDNDCEFSMNPIEFELNEDSIYELSVRNNNHLSPISTSFACNEIQKHFKPKPTQKVDSPRSVSTEIYTEEYQKNAKLFDKALDRNMLFNFSNSNGMPWRRVGLMIKSVFGDTDCGWFLFDKFCRLSKDKYDNYENRNIWEGFKVKDEYNNFGAIVNLLKQDNLELFYEIKKEQDSIPLQENLQNMILEINKVPSGSGSGPAPASPTSSNSLYMRIDQIEDPYVSATLIAPTLIDRLKLCKENWFMLTDSNLWKNQKDPSFYIINELRKYVDYSQLETAKRITQTNGAEKDELIETNKKYLKTYQKISSSSYLNVITKYLKKLLNDDTFQEKLDCLHGKFAFKNGIMDLRTKQFRKGILPSDYITDTIPYDYTPPIGNEINEMSYQIIKDNLKKVLNNNTEHLEYFLSIIGYSYIGLPDLEKAIYFMIDKTKLGKGDNGKTFFFDILTTLLPNYTYKSKSSFLESTNTKVHKQLSVMKGKRLVWLDEMPKEKNTNAVLMKEIGDGKTIENEVMFGTSEPIHIMFKLFALSNHIPKIDPNESAVYNRYTQISFNSHFDRTGKLTADIPEKLEFVADPTLARTIKEQYYNEVFYLLIDYANKYFMNKIPTTPLQFIADTNETKFKNDEFGMWFEEYCFENETGRLAEKQIIELSGMSKKEIREGMERKGFKYKKDLSKMGTDCFGKPHKGGYEGVSLKQLEKEEEEIEEEI
jgi:phage/plasmid-associated DNA primase